MKQFVNPPFSQGPNGAAEQTTSIVLPIFFFLQGRKFTKEISCEKYRNGKSN